MKLFIYKRSRSPSDEWDRKRKKHYLKLKKEKGEKINV